MESILSQFVTQTIVIESNRIESNREVLKNTQPYKKAQKKLFLRGQICKIVDC